MKKVGTQILSPDGGWDSPGNNCRLGTHPILLSLLFIPNPISAALRADGFGETPFYHCLVAEILSAPGEPQGKNTPTLEVPSPVSLKGISPRCPEA